VPNFNVQPIRNWKLRFVNTGAALAGTIFNNQGLCQMLCLIATSATTTAYLSTVFRIKRVQIWCLPSAVGVPCTVQAFFPNAPTSTDSLISGPPHPVTSTTLSVDRYAYVSLYPQRNSSFEGKWTNVTAGIVNMLVLTAPADAIVEIDFEFFNDDLGLPTAGPIVSGGVAGGLYHRIINGLTVQGLNSI
jgi:hypothetical protein